MLSLGSAASDELLSLLGAPLLTTSWRCSTLCVAARHTRRLTTDKAADVRRATTNDCVRRQHGQSWECRPQARLFTRNGLAGSREIRAGSRAQQAVPALRHPSTRRRPRLERCARLLGLPSPAASPSAALCFSAGRTQECALYEGGTQRTGTTGTETVRTCSPGSSRANAPIPAHLGQGGSTRSLGAGHTTQR